MPLLSYEEYKKKEYNPPYTLVIQSGENFLYYFGEEHSNDPKHSQWKKWRKFWKQFLEATEGKKRIVFTEGNNIYSEATEEESILKYGGMGLTVFNASSEGIKAYSPEPKKSEQVKELEKEFSKDEIVYFYAARHMPQWINTVGSKPNFEEYMGSHLERLKQGSWWENYDFSISHIKKIHKDIFGKEFDPNDARFFSRITDPVHAEESVINKISNTISRGRDEYIVQEIKKYMDDGYSVFSHFGFTHPIVQEPLLKEIL